MPKYAESMGDALRRMKQSPTEHQASRKKQVRFKKVKLALPPAIAPAPDRTGRGAACLEVGPGPDIPARVLRDRDLRGELAPRSLTAALLGDPLPGMSALDRRR